MVISYGNPRLAYADCSESCEYSKSYVSVSKAVYDGRPALPVQLHLNNSGLIRLFPVVQVPIPITSKRLWAHTSSAE